MIDMQDANGVDRWTIAAENALETVPVQDSKPETQRYLPSFPRISFVNLPRMVLHCGPDFRLRILS
jgi:hypothetical protein